LDELKDSGVCWDHEKGKVLLSLITGNTKGYGQDIYFGRRRWERHLEHKKECGFTRAILVI
jgi:hypothetical protein